MILFIELIFCVNLWGFLELIVFKDLGSEIVLLIYIFYINIKIIY